MLITTALPEELAALRSFFSCEVIHLPNNPTVYYVDYNIVNQATGVSFSLALSCINDMGNAAAGIHVANALHDLRPSYVFMFGIAGGFKKQNVRLADVLLPNEIVYYPSGKQHPQLFEHRPKYLRVDSVLFSHLRCYSHEMDSTTKTYKVVSGILAVGEEVIDDINRVEHLLNEVHPKLIGVEMEGYGAGLAAYQAAQSTRFAVVRGVNDYANGKKSRSEKKIRSLALSNAADFLTGFLNSPFFNITNSKNEPSQKLIAIHHLSLFRRPSIHAERTSYLSTLRAYELIEVLIDQTELYHEGMLADPHEALRMQNETFQSLETIIEKYPESHLAYFGLAHIPLMFQLGYRVNRRPIQVFGVGYEESRWFELPPTATKNTVIVEGVPVERNSASGDVIVCISTTNEIFPDVIPNVPTNIFSFIHIKLEKIQTGAINSMEILNDCTQAFSTVLQKIRELLPNTLRIHVYAATQPTLAFTCRQQVSERTDTDVIVYNYSKREEPKYKWGINIQKSEVIKN